MQRVLGAGVAAREGDARLAGRAGDGGHGAGAAQQVGQHHSGQINLHAIVTNQPASHRCVLTTENTFRSKRSRST